MQRILKALIVAIAALGLAAGTTAAFAQKAETPKADAKKAAEPAKPAAAPAKADAKADAKKADAKKAEPAKEAPKGEPMDINSASEKELATLKGIGDVRAKAIVKGRPYKGKDELVQKKIIPQNVYDDIKEQIIAKQDMAKAAAPKADAKKDEKKK